MVCISVSGVHVRLRVYDGCLLKHRHGVARIGVKEKRSSIMRRCLMRKKLMTAIMLWGGALAEQTRKLTFGECGIKPSVW